MPAAPEFPDGLGHIGVVKVLNEVEPKDLAKTNGHIAVTGEIEVNVQHEGNGVHPVKQNALLPGLPEELHKQSEVVRQNYLFGKTHQEPAQPQGHLVPTVGTVFQLPGHIHIPDNGTGDQLGEQGHIGAEADGVFLHLGIAPIHIDGIAEALEGIEADTHRQRQPQQRDAQTRDGVEALHEEVRVFENAQKGQADHHGHNQPEFLPGSGFTPADGKAAEIKQQYGANHQKQIFGLSPAIENQAEYQQHRVFQGLRRQKIHNQHRRQEIVQKWDAGK